MIPNVKTKLVIQIDGFSVDPEREYFRINLFFNDYKFHSAKITKEEVNKLLGGMLGITKDLGGSS